MIKKLQERWHKLNTFSIKIIGFAFFICASQQSLIAQDYNFSQFYNTPLNTNPALTGRIDQDLRIGLIYRNQWRGLGSPFSTFSFNGDMNFHKNPFKADLIGAGLNVVSDQSPDGTFANQYIMVSGAFHHWLDDDKRHRFSFGLQPGIKVQVFDPSKAKFANDDPNHSTGYTQTNFTLNSGLMYEFIATRKTSMSVGAGFFNLTSPKDGQYSNVRTPVRWNIIASVSYKLTPKLTIVPTIFYTNMASTPNWLMGANLSYSLLPKKDKSTFIVSLGGWYRYQDAAIIYGGLRFNNIQLGISYDFNASSLTSTNNSFNSSSTSLGAFEISLVYVGFLRRGIPGGVSVPCKIF